jgi:predicted glycosyltransferase involved in capsule biosynthesis
MKEYIQVSVLKQQDFQDYSKTDVEYAIDHCPRVWLIPFEELNGFINKAQIEWLGKTYDHETKKTLSEYVAEELLKRYEVIE